MTPVFISYDRRDKYFVNLLEALLDHENIESWCDRDRIAAGDRYQQRIQEGLKSSQSLIAVVSQHAVQSKWVTAEVATFCAARSDAVVIPIILDGTSPSSVFQTLEGYQSINMTEDMLHGFVALCNRFDRRFLSGQVQRRGADRRENRERRQSPLRRLRTGLWQIYASTTGHGKFDSIEFGRATQRAKIAEALRSEMIRYELHDENHKQIDAGWALQRALEAVAHEDSGTGKAVYLIEKVAAYLFEHYEVRSKTRRGHDDRRTKPDA